MVGYNLLYFSSLAWATTFELSILSSPPENASVVLPKDFMSFSIELDSYPDYAGNDTNPNNFTKNLIENLVQETAQPLVIRIGGATAERTNYDPQQEQAITRYWDYAYNKDQPKNVTLGPAYWQSLTQLQQLAGFTFDLNFALNSSDYIDILNACVNETLEQVEEGKVLYFEIGNEDDYAVQHGWRPQGWGQADFVEEWLNRTRAINALHANKLRFVAPSFTNFSESFNAYDVLDPKKLDINRDGWIEEVSQHGYMAGAMENPTLQRTLMNHTNIKKVMSAAVNLGKWNLENSRFFVMGETNSIWGQGAVNVSDVFGAALWGIDYALWMGSNNVRRMYFHQGTSYRYASWLPVKVNESEPHVKPPYYGNIFVSRFIGPSGKTQLANVDLNDDFNVAYAAYDDGKLARLAFLNLLVYNGTSSNSTGESRPCSEFKFPAPGSYNTARVAKMSAPLATSSDNITIDGVTYSYDNRQGKPFKVKDDSQIVTATNGEFSVIVGASEAVMVTFQ